VGAVALAIILLAIAVRFAALSSQPGGLYPDEGAEGLGAHHILRVAGFHPVFFLDDGGREALFAYLVAIAFRVWGESTTVLRAVSATVGVLAVVAVYPALRRFGRAVALAGMAWAAGALWLICISRDGMRNVLVPFFGALMIWALIRWADRPGRGAAIVAGAVAGAGLWTYQPLKLTPLLIALWLLWIRRQDRARYRAMRAGLGWAVLAYVAVGAPQLATAILDPTDYFGRAAGVSPFNPANRGIDLVAHTIQTLGMFSVTGDPNPRHNVASLPLLGWPLLALTCAGAYRCWRRRADPAFALLLLGVPVFLLPPLLGVDGWTPHFLRSLGLAPFLAGLVGIGAIEAVELVGRLVRPGWVVVAAVTAMAALLLGLGAGSAVAYFSRPVSARYQGYSYDVVALAAAAGSRDAVVIDDYNRIDIDFLDAAHPPATFASGTSIPSPGRYSRVLALSREDLTSALGAHTAARAEVIERAPDGRAAVWSVSP
jgi:4-amino-4-deoxy-L-arabinose transferase-like glycosyltransferase